MKSGPKVLIVGSLYQEAMTGGASTTLNLVIDMREEVNACT